MLTHPNFDVLLSRLRKVSRSGHAAKACCPAHDDEHPSLSVSVGDNGGIVVYCHAQQCPAESIASAVGMELKDFAPDAEPPKAVEPPRELSFDERIETCYDYRDEQGQVLYQVVRLHSPKDFRQRRPAGARLNAANERETVWQWKKGKRQVPYRLPELLAAPADQWLIIVEGEKDADALARLGLAVTTNAGGAGKWGQLERETIERAFRGRRVAILPDNDGPGLRHALEAAESLQEIVAEVRVVELPGLALKGDVSDWLIREAVAA